MMRGDGDGDGDGTRLMATYLLHAISHIITRIIIYYLPLTLNALTAK